VDVSEARTSIVADAMYVEPAERHHIDGRRILRYGIDDIRQLDVARIA